MSPKKSLDQESRDALIARAKKAGVERAERLTRVELLDELTKRKHGDPVKRAKERGLLGRARDLIAAILEQGLNLPDAASRVRDLAVPPMPPAPEPVATVTLAEIYAAQGHLDRAIAVLGEVLAQEPDHQHAALLLSKLTSKLPPDRPVEIVTEARPFGSSDAARAEWPVRAEVPETTPEEGPGGGPIPMLDDVPLPARYGVNEVVILPVDPTTALLYWEIARGGEAVLRVIAKVGDTVTTREVLPVASIGETYVYGLPAGATLMAEIVFRRAEGLGVSASNVVSVPYDSPSALVAGDVVVWGQTPAEVRDYAARAEVEIQAAEGAVRALRLSAAIARALAEEPGATAWDRVPEPRSDDQVHGPAGSSDAHAPRPRGGASEAFAVRAAG